MGNEAGDPKIGLCFSELMSGYLAEGEGDFAAGERAGKAQGHSVSFEVRVSIDDVYDFCKVAGRKARLDGMISSSRLGESLPIRNGSFGLFIVDIQSGKRRMTYSFSFTGQNGRDYFLQGYKVLDQDARRLDLLEDMTSLFTRIHEGDSAEGPLFGSGILRFPLPSLPSMLASFEVPGAKSPIAKWKAVSRFFTFCYAEVRDTYLPGYSPLYYAEYENLILRGKLTFGGEERNFFFFSGVHDKDFPWGDGESFWDIALIIQGKDGTWAKYAFTDRRIDNLVLNIEKGLYRYNGPIYQVTEGSRISWSELHRATLPAHLRKVEANIEFRFDPQKCKPVNVPFSLLPNFRSVVPDTFLEKVREWLPALEILGWQVLPHRVHLEEGRITLTRGDPSETYRPEPESVLGEGERSTFVNIRWPKLYYTYSCALDPEADSIHIRVRSDALRANRKDVVLDTIQQELGKIIGHVAALDLNISRNGMVLVSPDESAGFMEVEDTLLEISNDHFPTAVFQRRIVALRDDERKTVLGLQEDMDPLNLGSVNSERVVQATAIKDRDKYRALDGVLEQTEFFAKLESAQEKSGKGREAFSVIVKPNFMFMYSRNDPSTYTDPELIEHFMDRLHARGYRNLACAEARSTYGVYFTNREVKTVARYIGLSGKNYRLIDLSEDLEKYRFPGKLGSHFVNREWKNADFRIAFAKNKTHSYARYTLTLKAIYGALPLENKFLEYHHRRDIYSTAIEFLREFPVHFALIDAYISADGPFGIFADKNPNRTETIIGSEDLIAADWIGAAKMGLDPMVSGYMKKAVEAFGKPQIKFTGDRSVYPEWVNVTDVIPLTLFSTLDPHYFFGNLFYSIFAYMDDFFQYKDPNLAKRFARALADPITSLFFQKLKKGEIDEATNKKIFQLFAQD